MICWSDLLSGCFYTRSWLFNRQNLRFSSQALLALTNLQEYLSAKSTFCRGIVKPISGYKAMFSEGKTDRSKVHFRFKT